MMSNGTADPVVYAAFEVRLHGLKVDPDKLGQTLEQIRELLDHGLIAGRDPDRGALEEDVEVDLLEFAGGRRQDDSPDAALAATFGVEHSPEPAPTDYEAFQKHWSRLWATAERVFMEAADENGADWQGADIKKGLRAAVEVLRDDALFELAEQIRREMFNLDEVKKDLPKWQQLHGLVCRLERMSIANAVPKPDDVEVDLLEFAGGRRQDDSPDAALAATFGVEYSPEPEPEPAPADYRGTQKQWDV